MNLLQQLTLLSENKVEYISQRQGPALVQAYNQDTGPNKPKNLAKPEDILAALSKADPTKNQQFLQWLTNRYVKNDFSLEDAQRLYGDLGDFVRVRNRLPNKDINAYTLDKLYAAMQPLLHAGETASMKTMKKWEPNPEEKTMLDKGDMRVVYHDDQVRIFTPKTFDASCKLGTGTKWCTAWKDNPSHFQSYSKQGPLYVIHTPAGKFQFHFESGQHMNAQDRPAELGALIEKYPQIGDVFKELAEKHGVLGMLKDPSEKAMVSAVTSRPDKIKDLQPKKLNKNIVNAAMDNVDTYHLKDVFGYIQKFRPDLVDDGLKLKAIKADPASIKSLPPKEITPQQVKAAMAGKQAAAVVDAFRWLEGSAPNLVTDEVREDVLKKDGSVLASIGKKATPGMVSAALSDSDADHAMAAFKYAMVEMPEKVSDTDIEKMAGRSRFAMKFIPEEKQTKDVIKAALANDLGSFAHMRNPDDDTIVAAIAEGPFMIADNKYIRDRLTTDLLKKAVEISAQGILHELQSDPSIEAALDDKVDMKELYKHALAVDGTALEYVSDQTPELIKVAVTQNPKAWRYADKKLVAKDAGLQKLKQEMEAVK